MAELTRRQSKTNFNAFLWHAVFLALTTHFVDIDTIIPSMLLRTGGTAFHVGLLTAIMVGGARIFQLVFAGFIAGRPGKKPLLLIGINLRILSLLGLAFLLLYSGLLGYYQVLIGVFLLISIFSASGSFANVTYVDILGKSISREQRKPFFTRRQTLTSAGILVSAFAARAILERYGAPVNYALLFFLAGLVLAVASAGFWRLVEKRTPPAGAVSLVHVARSIPHELAANSNLKMFLILNNLMGVGVSIMPFLVLYAQRSFALTERAVGNFLLFKIAGMLIASLAVARFSRGRGYRGLLHLTTAAGVLVPLGAMALAHSPLLYQGIFFVSGVFVSVYRIAMSGILIEISNDENRVLYAGISGAGDISTAVCPILAGALVPAIGFEAVFWLAALVLSAGFYFTTKIDCMSRPDPAYGRAAA